MKIYLVVWSECDSGHNILGGFKKEADAIAFASKDHSFTQNGHTYTLRMEDIDIEEIEVQ